MGHYNRLKRGDQVIVVSGQYAEVTGVVESAVFQRTVDYPNEYAQGYHVVLDDGKVVTVRWDQVQAQCPAALRRARPVRFHQANRHG